MRLYKLRSILLILLISLSECLLAQQKSASYEESWRKVDSLFLKKGLTQSALAEANAIYARAKKEKNDVQAIKALVYRLSLGQNINQEDDGKSFSLLEKEITTAADPARSVLLSLLAEKYNAYFEQHRWALYERTQTVNFKQADIATWSIGDFHKKTTELYLASIKNTALLQQTKLETYDALILKGNVRYLRPTLYDLLAFRALSYFSNEEKDVTSPAYAFEIKDDQYFSPAPAFSRLRLITRDSSSLYHKALLIYQQLLAFHAKDIKPDALIDADIQRIQFVYEHGVMENKDSLYEKALLNLAGTYENNPAAAQAFYLVAQLHADRASQYNPATPDTQNIRNPRYEYLTAIALCKKALTRQELSEGKVNATNLLKNMERRELKLTAEKVNIPGQPFRALVGYRNLTLMHLRLVAISEAVKTKWQNTYDEAYWTTLLKQSPLRRWEQPLPATSDHQQHSVEIKTDALPPGEYVLLASADSSFSLSKNPMAAQYLYISNISYVSNQGDYFVLDRQTGKPLSKATVQQWSTEYDYSTRTNKKVKREMAVTDNNGYVHFTRGTIRSSMRLDIRFNNDHLFMDDNLYYNPYREEYDTDTTQNTAAYEKKNARVFFFTDRGIYRPGQTVYFKGIAISRDKTTGKSKVLSGIGSKVILQNANAEAVDSVTVTTSEYGSYSGKFILPKTGLNGEFSVVDQTLHGTGTFSVEEYKRPKFYVDYEKTTGSYRVNDSITVTGFAKAYAGNAIDGAQVKYRVERTSRFIYPWLFFGKRYPQSSSMEITNGVLSTKANGSFSIRFKAIPDLTVSQALDPVFDYHVTADITDMNGETRSGAQSISVSYKALQVSISEPTEESVSADSLHAITITTRNTAGIFEPALVSVSMSRLQPPARLIRARYWEQPDQYIITQEAFVKDFPLDEYKNESDFHTWPKAQTVWQTTDTTGPQKSFALPGGFPEGWYVIEAVCKDKDGNTVKDMKYVQLFNEKSTGLPSPTYEWTTQKNATVEPGNKSVISIGSSAGDLFVIQQVDKTQDNNQPASAYSFIALNNEKKTLDFPVTEAERGGFGVYHFYVKDNRFYSFAHIVRVPWSNKDLSVSYQTFRDKTLPGSEEKWTLKISGYKKEAVAAELLAGMYDASLDQLQAFGWSAPAVWPGYSNYSRWNGSNCFVQAASSNKEQTIDDGPVYTKTYDVFSPVGIMRRRFAAMSEGFIRADKMMALPNQLAVGRMSNLEVTAGVGGYKVMIRGQNSLPANEDVLVIIDGVPSSMADMKSLNAQDIESITVLKDAEATALYGAKAANGVVIIVTKAGAHKKTAEQPQIRKNFNETAFFFPDLKTDTAGNISFGFTIPEALTQWKFQALAHTKDLAFGYSTTNVVTQKPLMVQPNAPRFLREGDKMELSAKVANMTGKELTGTVQLELFNAATNQPADGWFRNMYPVQYFTAEAGQSAVVKFTIDVPYQYNSALVYRFVAKAGDNSDGEEALLPVLTNSMLVTESMPLPMRGNAAKNFKFEKLLQSGNSETLQQHALTVEFTTNPAWYAVQALPYLADYPYECAEQTFNRYYANALASMIAGASPKLKAIVDKWNTTDTAALLSNLQKNEALKAVLLEETPWVLQAKTEAQQKKNIALLFDMVRMNTALASSFEKLKQLQSPNGGFVWFKGGNDDRYITQYILSGIGHLKKLGALNKQQQGDWKELIKTSLTYLDQRIKEDYDNLVKQKTKTDQNNLGYTQVQYLYLRSLFNEYDIPGAAFTAINYYRKQSRQYWLQQSKYMQGMIALSLFRTGDIQTAKDILKSLKENAVVNDELGMYWKDNIGGYYWHQAPVETQSLLIEAFSEISKDNKTVDDLKTWLLKQKQVQDWKTTRATAEACYALLLQGSDWLNNTPAVEIRLGDKSISSATEKQEAGTGYFKKTIEGPFVNPSMGDISVRVSAAPGAASASSWGAVYWQYFEHLDKITPAATPLKLVKKLFVEKNTDRGPVLEPVAENASLKVGDKIKVRIELRVDRDMEYVHMKDMRASCMEPVNVLSGFQWQDGLGYYQSTKDASTSFFFGWLPKGTYVFEYPLFVTHTGNFSNGISSIQCMYAPEFSAHSEGIRVNVEQ